ncbi:MAG: metallophosphoesterase [Gemmatimonadaceae bacterium]
MTTRRRFVIAGAAAAAAAAAVGVEAFVREPRRLTVTRHRIGSGSSPMRIAQLSDLHLQTIEEFEREVAARVAELAPDVIVFTGDSIDKGNRVGVLDDFLALLDSETPKYAVLGNWDYWSGAPRSELRRVYEQHTCRLLINETVAHEHQGRVVHVTGADDLLGGAPNVDSAPVGLSEPHLLLAHCPAFRERAEATAAGRFTCMLAGHTHGGQVRFFGFAPVLPRGSGRYVSGWYRGDGRMPLYVSRGIGTSLLRARLGAPPEISLFEVG